MLLDMSRAGDELSLESERQEFKSQFSIYIAVAFWATVLSFLDNLFIWEKDGL